MSRKLGGMECPCGLIKSREASMRVRYKLHVPVGRAITVPR